MGDHYMPVVVHVTNTNWKAIEIHQIEFQRIGNVCLFINFIFWIFVKREKMMKVMKMGRSIGCAKCIFPLTWVELIKQLKFISLKQIILIVISLLFE